MIDKDEWLKEECIKIKLSEKKISKIQLIILTVFCLIGGYIAIIYCKDDLIDKSVCKAEEIRQTWECSKCGYKNYEGIERCAVCGKRR